MSIAIRTATQWYNAHLKTRSRAAQPAVVMLTDDAGNRRRATEQGIPNISGMSLILHLSSVKVLQSFQVRKYVEASENPTGLLDVLSVAGEDVEATPAEAARTQLYPEVCFANMRRVECII